MICPLANMKEANWNSIMYYIVQGMFGVLM